MRTLRDTKLYKCMEVSSLEEIYENCMQFCYSGKDLHARDEVTGESFMHLLADQIHKFTCPRGVSVVYIMGCKGMDMDVQDRDGNTFLHRIVRTPGVFRVLIAAIRCGADPNLMNKKGMTPGDILLKEKPEGWQETLHWYKKYQPGLCRALMDDSPDLNLVERLLRYWCRVTVVKNKETISLKSRLQERPRDIKLLRLLEEYENTIEFALAILSGKANIIRSWMYNKLMINIDINTKDHSYQYSTEDVTSPQPLLAALWETNNYDNVELMMELGVNTNVLFSYHPSKEKPKPLFFHLVNGPHKPQIEIVQRILRGSDMRVRNSNGQTLIYEAVSCDVSEAFIRVLVRYGTNLASRDRFGRTVRDHASMLKKPHYCNIIDDIVLQFVRDCDIERVDKLIVQGYSQLLDITDGNGQSAMDVAKAGCSVQLQETLDKADVLQKHIAKMFDTIDSCCISDLRRLMGKKCALGLDMCGRTVLHKAILSGRLDIVKFITTEYKQILNVQDNLGRTPLHYAYILLEDDAVADLMIQKGALRTVRDVRGKRPYEYTAEDYGHRAFLELRREVQQFSLDVFLVQTNFEKSFYTAIRERNFEKLKELVDGLKRHGDINRYNNVLFDCIDTGREDVAVFLIKEGMKTDIFKQYEACIDNDPICAMGECNHTVTSFRNRVMSRDCKEVLKLLDIPENNKKMPITSKREARPDGTVNAFGMFGLV